jgi:geranylgeranyl diphosphate synthase type II
VDVTAYLAERAALVDRFLDAELPPASEEPAALHAAMRHLLFPGGKRLRPAFALAACEAVGSPPERALPIAAAVELVHTYSLVHDDLPCMDDDALRRGRPTVHVAFGEAVAVLAGDALQAHAFELLARAGAGVAPEARLEALAELAHAAGSRALVGGQAEDLAFSAASDDPAGDRSARIAADRAQIERIHERKTAALFAAACAGGAFFGGAGAADAARLRRFGIEIGAAFQAADDVLDVEKDEACTLVRPLGVEGARARAAERLASGLAELESFGERAEPLRDLARFAVAREH